MNMFRMNPSEAMNSKGWSLVKDSTRLLEELMRASLCPDNPRNQTTSKKRKVEDWSVGELRNALEEASEDLDGNREYLVKKVKTITKE